VLFGAHRRTRRIHAKWFSSLRVLRSATALTAHPIQRDASRSSRRASLFWKLLASFAVLSLTGSLVLTAIFSGTYENLLTRNLDERLQTAAVTVGELLTPNWPDAPSEKIQTTVRQISQRAGVRITVIDPAGRVLADSAQSTLAQVIALENHRDRIEIVEALDSSVGHARRTSPTVGQRQRYVAIRVASGDEVLGVVRASLPTQPLDSEVLGLRRWMAAISILAAVASIGLAAWITAQATRPLRDLALAADALVQGDYDHRVAVPSRNGDEFAVVARALSEASRRLARGERQLRRTSQTQATVLEGMSESVIAVDRNEQVLFANASAGRLLGFRPEKVDGQRLLETVRSHELREVVHQALRSKQLTQCELTWRAGSPRTFDVLATPLPGDPSPGVVLVLRDVSEVKRLERMRQQFVANVSHELKTPLSSIKAYTETLLGGARNDPIHCERFLNRIDEQAGRLQDLILDMLSLARIESGQAPLDLADVSVARVVRRCIADHEPQAVARGVLLEQQIDDPNLRVHADEEALRQILSNLVDNAVKYTPAGGRVTVRCRASGKMVEIAVTDTGVGIPAEHHAHLFERFYRVDKARSRELGGTGLGLSIVKHLCQAMGGSVAVKSELGKGSTFSVQLPLAAS
jgi:two-component system phosphate regulon sensor histidine kinase PhoR